MLSYQFSLVEFYLWAFGMLPHHSSGRMLWHNNNVDLYLWPMTYVFYLAIQWDLIVVQKYIHKRYSLFPWSGINQVAYTGNWIGVHRHTLFRFVKSMHSLILLFFLGTKMMLETHLKYTCLLRWIKCLQFVHLGLYLSMSIGIHSSGLLYYWLDIRAIIQLVACDI